MISVSSKRRSLRKMRSFWHYMEGTMLYMALYVVTTPVSMICLASGFEPGSDDIWFICPM